MSFRLPFLRGMILALDCPVFAVRCELLHCCIWVTLLSSEHLWGATYDVKPLVPLLSSYRGYGKSQKARPHERGLKLDAEAALRHLLKRTDVNSSLSLIHI